MTTKSQLRMGYGISNQFIQLIPNNNLGLPIDVWLPVINASKPLKVSQLSMMYLHQLKGGKFTIGMFDKKYENVAEYNLNTPNLFIEDWSENIVEGIGESYGIESSVQYTKNTLDMNLTYTYCRSLRQLDLINNGSVYFSKFDRPHDFSLWLTHSFTKDKKLSFSFSYISGNPITLPVGRYVTYLNDEQIILEDFDEINNFRLPAIHHLDVSYSRTKKHKKIKSTLVLGVYNIYNRLNPFMAFIGTNELSEPVLKIRSLMPILPMVKYSIYL